MPTPATDHLEQAATAVVVLGVFPEMIRQLVDPGRQQCDLDRRAAAVFRMQLVLLDDFFLIEPHLGSASARVYAGREASPLLAYHASGIRPVPQAPAPAARTRRAFRTSSCMAATSASAFSKRSTLR